MPLEASCLDSSVEIPHPRRVHTLSEPKRLPGELQDVGLVSEPIEQGRRQALVAEDLGPVGKAQVGRHDHRHPLVQGRTELEDQLRAGGREGDEAQFVQDDQVLLESRGQEPGQLVLILGLDQLVDQAGGVVEADPVALPTGGQGQADGDVGLSQSGIADQQDRLRLGPGSSPRASSSTRCLFRLGTQEKSKSASSLRTGKRAALMRCILRFSSRWATSCSARANR